MQAAVVALPTVEAAAQVVQVVAEQAQVVLQPHR
jgi:hypothetical protein